MSSNRSLYVGVLLAVSFAGTWCQRPLTAQEPEPAKELGKLEPLVGTWRGEGTTVVEDGKPAVPWTSDVFSRWVLGGHFMQTDSVLRIEGSRDIRLREYHGWDRENQRYVSISISSMGEGLFTQHYLPNEFTIVSFMSHGRPQVQRSVVQFNDEQRTFSVLLVGLKGEGQETVSGSFVPVDKVEIVPIEESHASMAVTQMPGFADMFGLLGMEGSYDFEGKMVSTPGAEPLQIKGRDRIVPLFDGSIVGVFGKGAAEGMKGQHEAHAYYSWSASKGCFEVMSVTNFGNIAVWDARFLGQDKLVSIFAGLRTAKPVASRLVLSLDAKGRPSSMVSHTCVGDAEPFCDFRGTYQVVE